MERDDGPSDLNELTLRYYLRPSVSEPSSPRNSRGRNRNTLHPFSPRQPAPVPLNAATSTSLSDGENAFSPVATEQGACSEPIAALSEEGFAAAPSVLSDSALLGEDVSINGGPFISAAGEAPPVGTMAAPSAAGSRPQLFASTSKHAPSKMFHAVMKNALAQGTVAPGQPFPAKRVKMPLSLPLSLGADAGELLADEAEEECTAFCVAYELDLKALEEQLVERFGPQAVASYPENYRDGAPGATPDIVFSIFKDEFGTSSGHVIYFEFGVVVAWNLTVGQEFDAVFQLAMAHATQPLNETDVEVDEFKMQYSSNKPPQVQDDTIVLATRYCQDQLMKISVSLALAQSTRICVQEKQVMNIVLETKDLPIELAKSGQVLLSSEKLAQVIGSVFLQKSALNLQVLTGNGETPKFFYGRADYCQLAYKTVSDYLEMGGRIEVLNSRFHVLTDMLDLLRDQKCVAHEAHLEWIIITLIIITLALGVFQIASLLGVVSFKHSGAGHTTPGKVMAHAVRAMSELLGSTRWSDAYT